jgi:excisionase family DNA binding protein
MSVSYKAIIFDREREVVGWKNRDTLCLADGELALTPMTGELQGKIWRIATLKFNKGDWWINGEKKSDVLGKYVGKFGDSSEAQAEHDTMMNLFVHLMPASNEEELRRTVVGVAWLESGEDQISPASKGYLPHFLTRCDELARPIKTTPISLGVPQIVVNRIAIELFSQPFPVDWQSTDRRLIANFETQKCYELISFDGFAPVGDKLRKGLPVKIEKCWLPNRDYQRNVIRELEEWRDAGRVVEEPPEIQGFYYPPRARGFRLLHAHDPQLQWKAGLALEVIAPTLFNPKTGGMFISGEFIFHGTFADGTGMFFKEAAECPVPDEAKAQWQLESSLMEISRQVQTIKAKMSGSLSIQPEWFTGYTSAAKYAKVSERTIRNWVSREWLRVEKSGRKVRIARADLDKCVKKQ